VSVTKMVNSFYEFLFVKRNRMKNGRKLKKKESKKITFTIILGKIVT
jgi:hypothetical protein